MYRFYMCCSLSDLVIEVEGCDSMDRVLMKGNEALAEGYPGRMQVSGIHYLQ